MKRVFLILIISVPLALFSVGAQEDSGEKLNISVDVASGFVWRGQALNMSPVVQPCITFTQGKFTVGTWASTPFTPGEFQEFDFFASYQILPSLSIGIMDYYGFVDGFWGMPRYFDYKNAHSLDLQLIYSGSDRFPLNAMLSTIIYGNDWKLDKNGNTKNNFSTYFELGYGNTTKGGFDWEVFAGFVPMASDYYEIPGANFVNIGFGVAKNFEITPTYSLPLSIKFSMNPFSESVFLVASISLF